MHSDWFFAQREELEKMRQSGQRHNTIFEQSDKCGDDCLYTPGGGGRLSGSNQSKYTYRLSLQASQIFGKLWELSILLPQLVTGADFGCTSLLNTITRMMHNKELTPEKRRLVRGSDVSALQSPCFLTSVLRAFTLTIIRNSQGGSENVNFSMHALHATLVKRGVFDEIIWARLPPDHSHEEIDRLFSTIESWLNSESCSEFGCVSELVTYLRGKLAKSEWANASGCVNADKISGCVLAEKRLYYHTMPQHALKQ
eukprot:4952799-Pleurochrysis_carterae.AAC.1